MLILSGKIYGRVLVEKVRKGRGCVDQIITLRKLSESMLVLGKKVCMWHIWTWKRHKVELIRIPYGECERWMI